MRWKSPRALASLGVLGMNARNRHYIARHNARSTFPLVDDKLRTKRLLERHGIPAPRLLFVVDTQREIRDVETRLARARGFCIKPAKGSGGKGILVVLRHEQDRFVKASGVEVGIEAIRRHMSNALAGLFSLGGDPDKVIVEERIEPSPIFDDLSFEGVPDIRIVVYRGYPVMAMLRLATHASDGRANLHQGAVGVGIDIATGRAAHAVQHARLVERHPDTGRPLHEVCIPDWRDMLRLASRCHEITGLGYLGADLVLDARRGPQILELNARPGLAIQVANGCGLLPRLRAVEQRLEQGDEAIDDRIDYARATFTVPPIRR